MCLSLAVFRPTNVPLMCVPGFYRGTGFLRYLSKATVTVQKPCSGQSTVD